MGLFTRKQKPPSNAYEASVKQFMNPTTGAVISMATWTQDVETLLPVTEFISFVLLDEGQPEMVVVRWSDVESVAGHLMEPVAGRQKRVLVRDFPDHNAIETLRAQAVQL